MQISTPDSYQYSNNTTKLCICAWERFKSSVWKRLQKKWKRNKRHLTDVQISTDKNLARPPDTAKLRWKAILSVLDPTFGCFYWISRKQRLLGAALCYLDQLQQNSFSWALLVKTCLGWAYFIWLTEGVAKILWFCAKLVFMLFTIGLWHIEHMYQTGGPLRLFMWPAKLKF